MKKQLTLFLCLLLFIPMYGYAEDEVNHQIVQQTTKVKGTVTDEQGEPLIGASIAVKGTSQGVITDFNGQFSIDASRNATLIVSYVGYRSEEVQVKGQSNLKIVLKEDSKIIDEVVVTALGIKRERKALGYSIGEVKGEELEKAKETNVINSLAGKIPGLVISQTAGGPSGSSRVIVRGSTEMTGNNQPLYVVDGVPLDNSNYGSAGQYGGYDLGDGISSINPDDIESMSVLKGPAASALYGSRASHGVILITTKKANTKKKFAVELNSTTTFEKQLTKWDDVQYVYGQGTGGRINGTDDQYSSNKNWGPKIDPGLNLTYFDGVTRPYVVIPNNIDGFFRTGMTTTNTIVVSTVKDDTGIRATYTDMRNKDILPNTKMSRNTLNLRANTTINKKVDLDFKVTYTREDVKNRPALSDHRANPAKNLMSLATTYDQKWLRDNYKDADGNYYDWNGRDVWNLNPYWVLNEMTNESGKDKLMGSALVRYNVNEHLKIQVTGGADINFMNFQEYAAPTSPGFEQGQLQISDFRNRMYNVEALAIYNNSYKKFDYGVTIGGNLYKVDNKTQIVTAKEMVMRDVIALQSFTSKEITEGTYRKQINSLYGSINLAYGNFVYLDATLRGDHSSTLPSGNNTYLYPSVSGSFLFSEFFKINPTLLPYGKVRVSWAQVGSDTDPYQLGLSYELSPKNYSGYALSQIANTTIPNKDLKPTKTNSAEVGLELKFLKNRIGLDFTYYTQKSSNQIMRLNTTGTSGYNSMLINAGEIENKGVEIALNTRPIQTKDFSWDLNINFSKNSNKVKRLASGIKEFELESARWINVKVAAVEGENYGSILGKDFLRNDAGQIIVDASTGLPKVTEDLRVLGNATWKWTGGITTNLTYRDISLSAIFDIKVGADVYSMSARSSYMTGKDKATLAGRDGWYESEEQRLQAGVKESNWKATGGYVVEGVVEMPDGSFAENKKFVDPEVYWKHIADQTPVPFIYDNSYVKVREITLAYRLPKRWISKVFDAVSVSFVARNPFIIYKNVPNIDPDSNYNNGSGMGLEYGSLPSRRSYGFNVNVKF